MRPLPTKFILFVVAAAGLALAAFVTRSSLLVAATFGVLALAMIGLASISLREGRRAELQDSGVSTLVFPPESNFRPSSLPKR
jgi:hypothetical protein